MLETVHIENFKSLKNVTVQLQKVNLLIGPNNSGKSSFLKALAFIKEHLNGRVQPSVTDLNRIYFNHEFKKDNPILFELRWNNKDSSYNPVYHLELAGYNYNTNHLLYSELIGTLTKGNDMAYSKIGLKLHQSEKWFEFMHELYVIYEGTALKEVTLFDKSKQKRNSVIPQNNNLALHYSNNKVDTIQGSFGLGRFIQSLHFSQELSKMNMWDLFNSIKIYKPDPSRIGQENTLLFDKHVNEDCSNLVAFLDNMRDEYPNVWRAIEIDLNKCIPEFEGINFSKIKINKQESLGKRFGLRDKFGRTYWADELSEGTVYFLALLAIVHQPNPPKILMLEEPEKGIHPRRVSEVMNLIFRLAEDKDIQIILTTHSTQVVDEFQDIPESVFVFDLQEGETKIKNLLTDIIEPDNKKAELKNYPKLDFSKHTLGEHWAIGFLGGVPAK